MSESNLPTRTRAHLRALAHGLQPLVQVGGEGVSEAVIAAVDTVLERHELIKVRLGQSFEGDRRQAADELAAATRSALVQVIGRVLVLYRRRSKDDPQRPRIQLPA